MQYVAIHGGVLQYERAKRAAFATPIRLQDAVAHGPSGLPDGHWAEWMQRGKCHRLNRNLTKARPVQCLPPLNTQNGSGDSCSAGHIRGGVAFTATAPSSPITIMARSDLPPDGGPTITGGPASWPALQTPFSYYASAEDAQSDVAPSGLAPMWKLLLLSDGSVTRHLQLLSGSPVSVECLSMRDVGFSLEGLPAGTELIPGPRVQRQVLLRCPTTPVAEFGVQGSRTNSRCDDGSTNTHTTPITTGSNSSSSRSSRSIPGSGPPLQPLVYASSWWNADTIDEYLHDKSKPIWVSLSQDHVELYREVHALFCGNSPALEELLGCSGPFWGRQYVFWSGGQPLTLIYEVFSPQLQRYLGPAESVGVPRSR